MLYGAHEPNCVVGGAAGQSVRTTSGTELLDDDIALLDELLIAEELIIDELDEDRLELITELELLIELGAIELDGTELDETELERTELDGTITAELLELDTRLDDALEEESSSAGYAFLTSNWNASANQRPATGALANAPVPRLVLLPSLKV